MRLRPLPAAPTPGRMSQRASPELGAEFGERAHDLMDVVFVVVEVDRQPQIAVAAEHLTPRRFKSARSWLGSASPGGTDTMLLRLASGSSTVIQPTSESDALSKSASSRFRA